MFEYLGPSSGYAPYYLGDLRQVTKPIYVTVSSSVREE